MPKKKLLTTILRILLGLFFILGAILKLNPIEPLELLLVKMNICGWFLSPFLARLLIGFEVWLGAMLVLNVSLKKVLYLTAIVLIGFTAFLFYFRFIFGSKDNCGCLGSLVQMDPVESIIKNIVLLGLTIYLIIKSNLAYWHWKKAKPFMGVSILLVALAIPFVFNSVDIYDGIGNYEKPDETIEGKGLENISFNNKNVDLFTGRRLLCFYSLTCPQCKRSASKMSVIMQQSNNTFPIYIIFLDNNNREKLLPAFLSETHAGNIPYTIFDHTRFSKSRADRLPFLMFVENSKIVKLCNYTDMDPNYVIDFLSGN